MHWFLADLIQEPDLMAYLRAQEQIVAELIKSVRDVLPKHVRLNLIPTVQRPTAGCWVEGTGLTKLSSSLMGLIPVRIRMEPTKSSWTPGMCDAVWAMRFP